MKYFYLILLITSLPALAQQSNPSINESGGGGTLSSSCFDDCYFTSSPMGNGSTIYLMKDGNVVASKYIDTYFDASVLNEPDPPTDGNGWDHDGWSYPGQNDKGQIGTWNIENSWYFSGGIARRVSCQVYFIPELS